MIQYQLSPTDDLCILRTPSITTSLVHNFQVPLLHIVNEIRRCECTDLDQTAVMTKSAAETCFVMHGLTAELAQDIMLSTQGGITVKFKPLPQSQHRNNETV